MSYGYKHSRLAYTDDAVVISQMELRIALLIERWRAVLGLSGIPRRFHELPT